jgi:regulatory protein
MARPSRPVPPLDPAALERLALRYVERFATTRGRLRDYLQRKIRERGWEHEASPDPHAIAERMAELGYLDDAAWGDMKAASMQRRGLGGRRVSQALRHAGLEEADAEAVRPAVDARAWDSALAYARRRRLGPYAAEVPDRVGREKAIGALLRAGHGIDTARAIVAMAPGDDPEAGRE